MRDGAEHALRHRGRLLAELDVRGGDDDIKDLEHGIGQVQRPVLQDVDLDALQQRQVVHLLLHLRHLVRLSDEPLRVQAVHHGDPRRVVGDAQVAVAQRLRPLRHLEHGRAAVAPDRVAVDVAAVVGEVELRFVVAGRLVHLLAQPVQVAALAVLDHVGEHPRDALADALDGRQRPGPL